MGDLVTTCISPHSRNRTVGEQLGAGRTLDEITSAMNMVAEGLKTAVTAHELAERYELDLPVHDAIYRVVTGEMDAGNAYRACAARPATRPSPADQPPARHRSPHLLLERRNLFAGEAAHDLGADRQGGSGRG